MIVNQKKINERLDKEEEIRATAKLQSIDDTGMRVSGKTNLIPRPS